jgi:hypothetical protein
MNGVLLGLYRSPRGVPWGTTGVLQGCTEVLLWYHRGILRVLLDLGFYMCIEWVLLCYYCVTTVVLPWLKKVLLG